MYFAALISTIIQDQDVAFYDPSTWSVYTQRDTCAPPQLNISVVFVYMFTVCQSYFDNGCDKLFQECVFQQGWPVVVEEVDKKTFDVGAILILWQDEKC